MRMTKAKEMLLTEKEIIKESRKIFARWAIRILINEFENEVLMTAVMRLGKVERIIIVLNIVGDIPPKAIAYLLGTNVNSVYVQKRTALKKLRDYCLQEGL